MGIFVYKGVRLDVMLERSSLSEYWKELIREIVTEGRNMIELIGGYMNIYDYVEMHQLEPCTQLSPQSQKDINIRLNTVMADEKL